MKAIRRSQPEFGSLMRVVALSCIVLALFMSGLEAMHAHTDAVASTNSSPCVICLSIHANAPTVSVQILPQFHTVEAIAIPYQTEGKSAISNLTLFIRPPPVA
ncbi:MAG TPA: hypothetical protein VIB39_03535 [Candidatus Angelobacter sp.]|jgi:hypothetical protein